MPGATVALDRDQAGMRPTDAGYAAMQQHFVEAYTFFSGRCNGLPTGFRVLVQVRRISVFSSGGQGFSASQPDARYTR
jgi:hypothetical protein